MARVATVSLRHLLGDEVVAELARILCAAPAPPTFADADAEPPPGLAVALDADPNLEPFVDWDAARGRGRGFFRTDRDECASRRIDLRGPTDLDPGPLPMEEAPEHVLTQGSRAIVLL
jgi:hypothetical protein